MKLINYLSNKIPAFMVLLAVLALSSCGSYQYVGQTSDGIYETPTENVEQETVAIPAENNNDYYTNYFKEKSLEAEIYNESDDVFTDVDSYQGGYDASLEDNNQNAGWGATNENVVINVYDNGFNNIGWGWNSYWGRPLGWNRWGWNNWGWNNWGWNTPYWGGFNSWAWHYGGFYNPYNYSPYWGPGAYFNSHGYTNYSRRGIAYNSGRRGSLLNRNSQLSTRNSTVRSRTNTTTRPRTNTTTRPRTNTTTRPRSTNSSPRTNTSRPRSTNSTPRTSTPSRSSSTRSSSSSRSSSGSSRRGRG
ncbi:MAG: hypothetical protein WBF67_09735 [Olleya sp.]